MLLEMSTANEVATAYLFGTPPGWDVELSQPTISDPIEPDPPKDRVDKRLQRGERRQVQTEQPGYNVSVDRTVTKDGEVVRQQTFYSAYQPQQEIWAVGEGTTPAEPTAPAE
jgi:hypothetical protein